MQGWTEFTHASFYSSPPFAALHLPHSATGIWESILQRKEHRWLIYPRRIPQGYHTISQLLLCQTCWYITSFSKEKLSILNNIIIMDSCGFYVRSVAILPQLKTFLAFWNPDKTTMWLPPPDSVFICCSVWYWSQILPQTTPVHGFRFVTPIYNSQCLSS